MSYSHPSTSQEDSTRRSNRRRANRVPISLPAAVHHRKEIFPARTRDFSPLGVFVLTGQNFKKGMLLELRLRLPGRARELNITVKVAHILTGKAPNGPGAGLEFVGPDRGARKDFSDFFSSLKSAAHKDRAPRDTIDQARKLLRRIGIFPIERVWHSFGEYFHSVRLADQELPISANGKGVTREFALASAYGEFMERLQNGRMLPEIYGLMPDHDQQKEGRMRNVSTLRRELRDIMTALVPTSPPGMTAKGINRGKARCVPFYSVTDGRTLDLPIDYISQVCSSNGLCAGNTPEEALVEGLCEIAERHVMREIILGKHTAVPTIPIDIIGHPHIREKIKDLAGLGYSVTIKDCTMGGRFPVLAAIITSDKRQGYMSRFGASPDFAVAIERCLSEAFQGVSSSETIPELRPLSFGGSAWAAGEDLSQSAYRSFYSEYRNGSGFLPKSMFLSAAKPDYRAAFLDVYHSNRNALKHMLDRFHMSGARVFIRDSSHLGFPAFRIYVPGFTEISRLNADIPADSYNLRKLLGRDLLRLKKLSTNKTQTMAVRFEKLFSCPVVNFESSHFMPGLIEVMLGIWIKGPNDFNDLCQSRDKLLAVLFHRAGNHKKAARYFQAHLEAHPEEASSYTTCCLAYFILKADRCDPEGISAGLMSFFGRELTDEVVSDLKDPGKAFRYYQLPDCGDCSSCEINKICLYPAWKRVTSAYREFVTKNPVDQSSLKRIFSTL